MSDHRDALEAIMRECANSRTYTRRVQVINTIAMKALGMTAGQRHAVHLRIMERIGDEPMKARYLERRAKADARMSQFMRDAHGIELEPIAHSGLLEAAQHEDAHGAYHLDGAA